ncbi:MAG: cobaltochelatase subunit CobN, partial [Methanophagales archaeon]|nr:cobaltochelatase subunit CobN [Methanophagales archaeon]
IYHPDAHGFFFCNTADYIAWAINRTNNPFDPTKPTIGILGSRFQIAAGDLALSNALIRQIEASGANVILVYPDNIRPIEPDLPLFYYNDTLLIDAAITLQTHIAGVPYPVRRDQFIEMGVPILGATVTGMTPCEWKNCTRGIPLGQMWRIVPREIKGVFACTVVAGQDEDKFGGRIHVPLPLQIERLVNRTINHANLGRMENSEKNIAIIYYNHPPGRHDIGASGLNVPRSLERLLIALYDAGYNLDRMTETEILAAMQAHGINVGQHAQPILEAMVNNHSEEIVLIPVADYQRWFEEMIPEHRQQEVIDMWGPVPGEVMVVERGGREYFVIPMIRSGNILIMPQPTRGGGSVCETIVFHNLSMPPHHQYIAFYLWLQQQEQGIDAIIHFGTHGTQEWLPGKERGLATDCWPYLMSGEIPIVYPYIIDNVGEATQAKRRGDAVIISHMTPVLVAAGLHGDLRMLHDMIHDYLHFEEGPLRDAQRAKVIEKAINMSFDLDMGHPGFEGITHDTALINQIHQHIHCIEAEIIPLGLHVLGDIPEKELLTETVMKILGLGFVEEIIRVGRITGEHECEIEEEARDRAKELLRLVINQTSSEDAQQEILNNSSVSLTKYLDEGRRHLQNFLDSRELEAILDALSGRFIPPSMGGDPIRSPDSLPTGRNLYSFDPRTVPLRSSWEVGRDTMQAFLADYYERHGVYPDRIASILWVVETMRHRGVAEAQILYALGVEPIWDTRDRVRIDRRVDRGLRLIPDDELGRPRIDVTVIISGLYRDVFSCRIEVIDAAVRLVIEHEEVEGGQINHVRRNYLTLKAELIADGMPEEEADILASARIFGPPPGAIGPNLDDAIKASGTWDDKSSLIDLYLSRMGHIHSRELWGENHRAIFERALSGTDVAMLSRSSNYFGVLNTDGPFEWLGGLSMVIEHLDGTPPELMISDLRNPHKAEIVSLSEFIRRELRARYYNPRWIEGQMEHGYSGAREMAKAITNLWGFQVTTPHLVTDDMWNELFATLIQDKHDLGLDKFFDANNPWAQQSVMARMLETVERGWWDADPATIQELTERYIESVAKYGPCCCAAHCANDRFDQFIAEMVREGKLNLDRGTIIRFNDQRIATLGDRVELISLPPEEPAEPVPQPRPRGGGRGIGIAGLEPAVEPAPAPEPAPEPAVAEDPAAEAAEPVVGEVIEVVTPVTPAWRDIVMDLPVTAILITILLMGLVGIGYMAIVKKRR